MSADFEAAVMLGATAVRVGTALFEDDAELRRDHLRLRRRASRERVRGPIVSCRAAHRPRASRTASRTRSSIMSGSPATTSSPRSSSGSAARFRHEFHERMQAGSDARAARRDRGGRRRGRLRAVACRRSCPRRSLHRARPGGSRRISTISASPTRSASMSTAAASMSKRGKPAPDLYLHAARPARRRHSTGR